ncbi:MAG: monovalent cation/H+ antiporter complex subunit F [Caldilineales bacterium]|nr:monovalent cation/H+ antiporter complex subunit F [Caldilineales bacterium]MDW8318161.1 monovalent cation/H+ antiporter complex subunit F [Anaerolineae bacterium]
MLASVLNIVLVASLVIHMVLMVVALRRLWRGENIVDRLLGADITTTLTIAVLVLLAVLNRNSLYLDVALGLAALGFVATVALAKYIADEQMF